MSPPRTHPSLRPFSLAQYHYSMSYAGPVARGKLAVRRLGSEEARVRPASEHAIEVKGLRKSYGDWPVLRDLDLTVQWGEFLVLFGANGVGKTTLLRILSTQARPDAGAVRVAGYDYRRQAPAIRRRVGVVGHKGFLYDDLTCRENLTFYGRLFKVKDIRQRSDAVLSRVGLSSRADQRVSTLSHGMQKRLSIARAILHRPPRAALGRTRGLDWTRNR